MAYDYICQMSSSDDSRSAQNRSGIVWFCYDSIHQDNGKFQLQVKIHEIVIGIAPKWIGLWFEPV